MKCDKQEITSSSSTLSEGEDSFVQKFLSFGIWKETKNYYWMLYSKTQTNALKNAKEGTWAQLMYFASIQVIWVNSEVNFFTTLNHHQHQRNLSWNKVDVYAKSYHIRYICSIRIINDYHICYLSKLTSQSEFCISYIITDSS